MNRSPKTYLSDQPDYDEVRRSLGVSVRGMIERQFQEALCGKIDPAATMSGPFNTSAAQAEPDGLTVDSIIRAAASFSRPCVGLVARADVYHRVSEQLMRDEHTPGPGALPPVSLPLYSRSGQNAEILAFYDKKVMYDYLDGKVDETGTPIAKP